MKFLPNAITREVATRALSVQASSPRLLFGTGVVGMIGSTVLACRATLKVADVLDNTNSDAEIANELAHETDRDRKKDLAFIYTRGIVQTGRLYLPAIALGTASIACLTKSHTILRDRNLALTAAYTAVDEAFSKYRGRVIEKYGEDQDREFRFNTEQVEVLDEDSGKLKTITRAVPDPDGHSMYARWFDEKSPAWNPQPDYNWAFLRAQQEYFNMMLQSRGYVFLNEIYDRLGIEWSKAGQVVGWVVNNPSGDSYIDFGFMGREGDLFDFNNGREGGILLDFNVDGNVLELFNSREKERA